MDIRRIGAIKDGENVTGSRTRIKVVKNKVAPPFKEVEFDIMYGEGISKIGDLVDVASTEGIIEKSGAWYSYNNQKLGQGREQAKATILETAGMMEEIRHKVFVKHGITKTASIEKVDMATGEITEDATPSKKTKKVQ